MRPITIVKWGGLILSITCLSCLIATTYVSLKIRILPDRSPYVPKHCSLFTATMPKTEVAHLKQNVLPAPLKHLTVLLHDPYIGLFKQLRNDDNVYDFFRALEEDESLNFVEVGSGLGVFSLIASSLQRHVVAIDAKWENLLLLDASLRVNGLRQHATLVYNGVSNERLPINRELSTILAYDLLEVMPFRKAILKLDIEKQEYEFFQRAHELFRRVDFPIVLMEWLWFSRHPKVLESDEGPIEDYKVTFVIRFFLQRGYKPYSHLLAVSALSLADYSQWPTNIIWMRLD